MRFVVWLILAGMGVMLACAEPALAQTPRVAQVRIEGAQRIEPDTVRSYLAIKVGDQFDADLIDRSLKSLFNTGLFADVAIARAGDELVVRVVENPIINRLAFEGNKRLDDSTLTNEVQLRPRVVYTRTKVQNDVKRLLDLYRRNGRFAATVEPKIIQLPQNRVDLVFEVDEGERTGIGRITFIGNRRFSDGALRGVVQTTESRWYRFLSTDDSYDPDRVTFDRELLRRHYLKNGYADFRVLSAVAELSPNQDAFYLTFTLEEGERYKFGKIDMSTTLRDLDPEVLRAEIQTKEGNWYNAEEVEDTVRRLTDAVGNLGYAFVEIEPVVQRNRDDRTIGISFEIREGPKVFVERIDIAGNVRTLDRVIRREFRLVEGDAFNTSRLRRSQQRIRNLGFFRKVDITNQPGSAADRTVIQVQVEEQSTGELTLGAGYSTADGPLGEIAIRERNLLGRGQDLRLATTVSGRRQQFDISFTEPYFLDRNISAGIDLFRIQRDLSNESSYDFRSTGLRPRFGFQLSERLRETIFYTLRQDEIYNVENGASRYIREQEGERVTSMVGQDLFYDALDSRLDPTDGYYLALGTDFAGAGGDVAYTRVRLRAGYYYPLYPEYVVSVRGEAGYIVGLGENVRINDRFFPGGDNLRGFAIGGAGPRDIVTNDALGGNRYYTATLEVSFPLGLPKELGLTGRAFTDIGGAGSIDVSGPEIRDTSSIRAAAGVGLSWRSPFGPIRIDFAVPYLKEDFDKTENFRFSFGTKF